MNARYLLIVLLFASIGTVRSEHLPGGNITYRCTGGNTHEITLQLWRECSGASMIPQTLNFLNSCGVSFSISIPLISQEEVSPICPGQLEQTTCNGGSLIGIEVYTYRTSLFLSSCNFWTIYWHICCRQTTVNLSEQQGLYIEARLNNAGSLCIESPVFAENSPPFACVNQPVSYDIGASIPDGSDLRFRLIGARRYTGQVEPVLYLPPYSGAEPFTGMVIDSLTGQINFTPTIQGYVVCVVEVNIYNANGVWIGSVMRDFPFVVQSCTNNVPPADGGLITSVNGSASITGPREVTGCTDASFCFEALITDPDAAQVLSLTSNLEQSLPGATIEFGGTNPVTLTVCWDATGIAPGTRTFAVSAQDDACPVRGSQTYTYTVIIGESPLAGTSNTISYCSISSAFALIDSLPDASSTDGVWSGPNGVIDGNFDPSMDPPGEYVYTLIGANGCEGQATLTMELLPANDPICIALGFVDQRSSGFVIGPNPTNGNFFIDPAPSRGSVVQLTDLQGRTVWMSPQGGIRNIALPGSLANGSYILRVVNGTELLRSARVELMR